MHQWRYLIPGELIVMDDELALDGIWTLAMVLGHRVGQYERQHFRRKRESFWG